MFDQRTDWKEDGTTPVRSADLLRIEQGIKDNEGASDANTTNITENAAAIDALGNYTEQVITGTTTCVIDMDNKRYGKFTFAKTVPVSVSFINLPSGEWGCALEITDDGGDDAVTYDVDIKEDGGVAMAVTAGGMDRWIFLGNGSVMSKCRVAQRLDVRAA